MRQQDALKAEMTLRWYEDGRFEFRLPTDAATAITTEKSRSGSSPAGVDALARATSSPSAVTSPAASLVPPTSIARATSILHPTGPPAPHAVPACVARTQ